MKRRWLKNQYFIKTDPDKPYSYSTKQTFRNHYIYNSKHHVPHSLAMRDNMSLVIFSNIHFWYIVRYQKNHIQIKCTQYFITKNGLECFIWVINYEEEHDITITKIEYNNRVIENFLLLNFPRNMEVSVFTIITYAWKQVNKSQEICFPYEMCIDK